VQICATALTVTVSGPELSSPSLTTNWISQFPSASGTSWALGEVPPVIEALPPGGAVTNVHW
jgi:hypothetical protein